MVMVTKTISSDCAGLASHNICSHKKIFAPKLQYQYEPTIESGAPRLTSLTLRELLMSLRCRLGVPWLHPPGVPPICDDGVPKTQGELMSISEVGSAKLVGGDEMR